MKYEYFILYFAILINDLNLINCANIIGRIYGGAPLDAPWQVYILGVPKFGLVDSSHCGGSLITSNAILTSANCVDGFDTFTVQFGSLKDRPISVQHVNRSNVIIHPRYNASNFNNDIAIIKLTNDIYFNDQIQPVLLPRKSDAVMNNFNGTHAFISGWGSTSDGSEMATILRSVMVRIISNEQCSNMVHESILVASTICSYGIGDVGNSACAGDEGGPLVQMEEDPLNGNKKTILIGIISFTHTKCSYNNPTGYIATAFYVDWIKQITGLSVQN